MKRFLFTCLSAIMLVCFSSNGHAQIPVVPNPVCAYCGVDLKSNQPHKRGCKYYSEPTNEESSSSSSSSSNSSSSSKPSGPTKSNPFADGYCPECGGKVRMVGEVNLHRSGCRLGEAYREYYRWWNVSLHDKKKKVRDDAWSKMQDAYAKCLKVAEEALRRGHPTTQTPTYPSSSSSSSYSYSSSSSSVERMKFSYECDLCKASVMAHNINEAIREFANNPWLHKPTCKSYKPKPGQGTSTKLKDYTPAPERPTLSEPLMDMPMRQPAPQFSGINETNIRHEKPVSIIGQHEWGKIDEGLLSAYESLLGEDIPREFDIERFNHDKGAVVLGTHKANGRYHWTILERLPNGDLRPVSQQNLKEGSSGYKNIGQLTDVHFEGQGKFIIAEYTSGYRQVYNANGELMREGRDIKVLGSTVEGKRLLYVGEDEQTLNVLLNEDGDIIVSDPIVAQYDDAIIVEHGSKCSLSNWRGDFLQIDDIDSFDAIKAFNNNGSYYLLKDNDEGFAVVGRGFQRVGGWYKTEEEAHRAWRASR